MEKNELKCNSCDVVKDIEEFYYNEKQYAKTRYFRSGYCKDCSKKRNLKYSEKRKEDNIDVEKEAKTILKAMGYEVDNPDNPVHKQFQYRFDIWSIKKGL